MTDAVEESIIRVGTVAVHADRFLPSRTVLAFRPGAIPPRRALQLIYETTGERVDGTTVRMEAAGDGHTWVHVDASAAADVRREPLVLACMAEPAHAVPAWQSETSVAVPDHVQVRCNLSVSRIEPEARPSHASDSTPTSIEVLSSAWHELAELREGEALSFFDGHALSVELTTRALNRHSLLLELRVHNPRAAAHDGGLWDLGDPASIHFRSVELEFTYPPVESVRIECLRGSHPAMEARKSASVTQHDEGEADEQSDAGRSVSDSARTGYELRLGDRVVERNRRSEPVASVRIGDRSLRVHPLNFWQESPGRLYVDTTTLRVGLLGRRQGRMEELQPGEAKRRQVLVHVTEPTDGGAVGEVDLRELLRRSRPVVARIDRHHLSPTAHCMRSISLTSSTDRRIGSLLIPPACFVSKREAGREYGWRNFGEVFADHESLYLRGKNSFVSHYNNQYDMIFGFAMQYIRTGDLAWLSLMDDLARHVVDIDIYQTDGDRSEYNRGLFWHTNHYVDAATATHRTFSSRNYDPAEPVGTSGGPGSEHCYTTGLMLHYRITGDPRSRRTVLDLASWIRRIFFGDDCLLGKLHSLATRELPALTDRFRARSSSACLGYPYPLNRGTGNFLIAMMDAFLVDRRSTWIRDAERVLGATFDGTDDIRYRNLLNSEENWSYTVFLQAVLRYLDLKESLGRLDEPYWSTRHAFVALIDWMSENERPYLQNEQDLEFPNLTWAAQEIRKVILLKAGAAYNESGAEAYGATASKIEDHMFTALEADDTVSFTRIQAILLQNVGWISCLEERPPPPATPEPRHVPKSGVASRIVRGTGTKAAEGLRLFNPRAEVSWVRTRL